MYCGRLIMNDDSVEDRLCKFFSTPLRAAPYSGIAAEAMPPLAFENAPRLADLLEYAIRGIGLHERSRLDESASVRGALPERLIEELKTAQEQMRAEPPVLYEATLGGAAGFVEPQEAAILHREEPSYDKPSYDEASYDLVEVANDLAMEETAPLAGLDLLSPTAEEEEPMVEPEAAYLRAAEPLNRVLAEDWIRSQAVGLLLADRPKTIRHRVRNLVAWMRLKEWNRRRLALLSQFHRHVFDRGTEQLLFYKTDSLNFYQRGDTEENFKTPFFWPMPKLLLDWTLSALPRDLKHYAFVDFRARNGRTLLFAARHHFEYVAGYAFDAGSTEILEMNLAQYPRTRLACRDVRALRGDRDGVIIPSQPAVLFFPDSLSEGHLDIILSYVSASLRASPRPIYLIFENAGREQAREQMSLFENVRLPLFNRGKAFLFAPARVAVYRSKIGMAS